MASLGALCTLAACTVGPNFKPPAPIAPTPQRFNAEPADVKSTTYAGAVDVTWWTSFKDPELTSLIGRLARQNLDLQIAAERVRQARSQRRIALAQGLPQIDARAQYTHERESPAGMVSLVTPAPGAPLEFNLWQDSLAASWEIDLFGRVRRSVEAASADTEAQVEARRSLALAAISDVATDYLQLRDVQTREGIARQDLQLASENLALVRNRFDNGVATTLDMAQASAQRATIASMLPELLSEKARLINAIGLLLAEPPRSLQAELSPPKPEPGAPPRVPVGLPGDLVRRRPDVREAEARLHEATAQTGVAVADFYPDITLMGDEGLQGLRFADAFSPRDRQFDFGPSISLPIFHGGRLRATLQLAQVRAAGRGHRFPEDRAAGLARRGRRPDRLRPGPAPPGRGGRGAAPGQDRPRRRPPALRRGRRGLPERDRRPVLPAEPAEHPGDHQRRHLRPSGEPLQGAGRRVAAVHVMGRRSRVITRKPGPPYCRSSR